jgi:hypothetical protein
LIAFITFGEVYKLWSSSLCILLQSPATSFLLGPNIFLSTLFQTPWIHFLPLVWETKFRICTKQRLIYGFTYVIFTFVEMKQEEKPWT